MNPQTRALLKVTPIALVVSFLFTGISLLSENRTNPIDPFWSVNPALLGEWVGSIVILPIIVAIVVIAMRFRAAPGRVAALNLLGAGFGIFAVTAAVVVSAAAIYPIPEFPFATAGPGRDSFVKQVMSRCLRAQRGRAENKDVSD